MLLRRESGAWAGGTTRVYKTNGKAGRRLCGVDAGWTCGVVRVRQDRVYVTDLFSLLAIASRCGVRGALHVQFLSRSSAQRIRAREGGSVLIHGLAHPV